MPTYEFACTRCGHGFEARVPRIDGRPDGCPACGAAELQKLLSAPAVRTGAPARAPVEPCSMGSACGRLSGRCGAEN